MIPIKPPVKKAIYNEIIILGKPKNNPKRKTNLMSPLPMLSFFVRNKNTTEIITKKRNAPIPQRMLIINDGGLIISR
jgi:hypothetical protein